MLCFLELQKSTCTIVNIFTIFFLVKEQQYQHSPFRNRYLVSCHATRSLFNEEQMVLCDKIKQWVLRRQQYNRCILFLHRSIQTIETTDQKLPVCVQINQVIFSFSYGEVMQYFFVLSKVMFFSCHKNENIRYAKCPISTHPAKKITLACYACLCFITGATSLFLCCIVKNQT